MWDRVYFVWGNLLEVAFLVGKVKYDTKLCESKQTGYPVGVHNDHFKDDDQSLENKIMMAIEFDCDFYEGQGCGGGCIMSTHFVYTLLDW